MNIVMWTHTCRHTYQRYVKKQRRPDRGRNVQDGILAAVIPFKFSFSAPQEAN